MKGRRIELLTALALAGCSSVAADPSPVAGPSASAPPSPASNPTALVSSGAPATPVRAPQPEPAATPSAPTRVQIHCTIGVAPSAPGPVCGQSPAWVAVLPAAAELPEGSCDLHQLMVGLIRHGMEPHDERSPAARKCADTVEYLLAPGDYWLLEQQLGEAGGSCQTGIRRRMTVTTDGVVTDLAHADLADTHHDFVHVDLQNGDVVDDFTCTD